MTLRAVGFGRGFPPTWLIPIAALTGVLGIAATGRFSRSIVADLIAWWPIWLGLVIVAYLLRDRKVGALRVSGLVPLAALLFVGLFTWGHAAGWSIMPSASHRLVGPEVGTFAEASLEAKVDGSIEASAGSEFLYQVEPIRRGGRIGIPGAGEEVVGSAIAVTLQPGGEPGLYAYAGWDIRLSDSPSWALSLDGAVDADLSGLRINELILGGAGEVHLGAAPGPTEVTVSGIFRVVIPKGSAARVVGGASVPADWTLTSDGAVAPGGGDGWVISARPGAKLSVSER